MITLSGVYCLLCSPAIKAADSPDKHCPFSKVKASEHCDFSKKKVSEPAPAATGRSSFACCGPRFNFFVAKLEKNELPQQTPVLASNFFTLPGSVKPVRSAGFTDFSYRSPIFESRHLHIKNCVFRI